MSELPASAVSFRDPDAVLVPHEGRFFRIVRQQAAAAFAAMLEAPSVRLAMANGHIVSTWRVSQEDRPSTLQDVDGDVYEHEAVRFVSYPCEWSPTMVAAAARLTLDLADSLLNDGFVLKDATPANILFRGSQPVFVDVASIVPRMTGQFLWFARQQFEATFLLPLMALRESGLPLSLSLQNPVAGLSHEETARLLGARRWMSPRLAASVALPAMLSRRAQDMPATTQAWSLSDDRRAMYVLKHTLKRLDGRLNALQKGLKPTGSAWQGYTSARCHYQDQDLGAKIRFVEGALERIRPSQVLDVGANTGEFSRIAARFGAVVALEADPAAADRIFQQADSAQLPVSTIVANFARPTPALGWRNRESLGLTDRLHGRFDFILMLAVVHHLRVTGGIPVREIFDHVAELTTTTLLVEHVPPSDPMFRRIARGRESLYGDCEYGVFLSQLESRFSIVESQRLDNGRTLLLATVRD